MAYNIVHGLCPDMISEYGTRNFRDLQIPRIRIEYAKRSLYFSGVKNWNYSNRGNLIFTCIILSQIAPMGALSKVGLICQKATQAWGLIRGAFSKEGN